MVAQPSLSTSPVIYPDSDGKPMADNTLQWTWIVIIKLNLDSLFATDPNVFVAGDLLWYPVEGDARIAQAPDVLVAFDRPKGYRGSYIQHREDQIPPQVVFEILSPSNTRQEMEKKLLFYDRYGVEEYYLYDPDTHRLEGWIRQGSGLDAIPSMAGWVSPRLGIRFEQDETQELQLYRPDGTRFESFEQIQQRAEREQQRAERERQRADRLAERLRDLGLDPDAL